MEKKQKKQNFGGVEKSPKHPHFFIGWKKVMRLKKDSVNQMEKSSQKLHKIPFFDFLLFFKRNCKRKKGFLQILENYNNINGKHSRL